MAYQSIELGTAANDGSGDTLRVGGDKVNDNFVEIYTALGTGTALSSGISASSTVITLSSPVITDPTITGTSTITLDAETDIILDAKGGDIYLKDDGTIFGTFSNNGGNLVIKNSSAEVSAISIAGDEVVTFADDLIIKDGGTIGVTSAATAMTISSAGIVTFVDDILIKDGGTIGVASAATAITVASTGIVTLVDDLILKDAATIGVTSSTSAISIAATGIVTFIDDILLKDAATIGNASVAAVMTLASTGIVTFVDDIILKDAATIGVTSSTSAISIASSGIVTLVDDLILKDAATIGVTSSTSAITIASTGIVTLVDDLLLKDACTIGTATTAGAIAIAADGTVDLATAGATVNSVAIKSAGKESIWIPASAMYPSTTNPCADLAQVETTALRPDLKVLDFDASSDEFAQFTVAFPKSWNEGTVTFQPFWTVTGTNTGTVAWQLGGIAVTSDATINTAFGTLVAPAALAHSGTSNDLMVSVESGAVTIAGSPSTDDVCFFQINRDISADAQSGDARLIGIKLFFTTDAANDG